MRTREGQIQINQRRTGENFPGIVWLLKNFLKKFPEIVWLLKNLLKNLLIRIY